MRRELSGITSVLPIGKGKCSKVVYIWLRQAEKGDIVALHHLGTFALVRIATQPQPRHDIITANQLIL